VRKITVATTFGVYPPRGGGQARVAGLYGALARLGVEVEIVALVDRTERPTTHSPAPGVTEVRVPRTPAHDGAAWKLQQRADAPVGDIAVALHHDLTPAYGEALAEAARGACAVVACHPYGAPALAAAAPGVPLIYEAQDVEADLKAAMYEGAPDGEALAATVRDLEAECCARADHVLVCAERDGRRLGELYGLAAERVVEVPNGSDPAAVPFTPLPVRRERQRALHFGDELHALFVGSWHEPNIAVIRELLNLVDALEGVRVIVCGSAGLAFSGEAIPGNFDICGVVDDGFLRSVLAVADVALNPMRWGSGTNLKMFDYALAGVPLVCSAFGNRGVGFEPERQFLLAEPEELPTVLARLRAEDDAVIGARVRAARDHVEERFSWARIAGGWHAHPAFQSLLASSEVRA
jgi:glycosyltransferase involved in cell wall biosynthesis